MEILNQITVLVSNPPQGSGNQRRLKKGFDRATASTRGFMNFEAFSRAIRYPLKKEVLRKLFDKHFNEGDEQGVNYNRFLKILTELDKSTREDRIKAILDFYKDDKGMISFEDFKNIIAVALQQIDFRIGEVELHRLAETILKCKRPGYEVESVRQIIKQWNSLDKRIGDILYTALFLKPKVPLDPTKHNNRYPSISRPKSTAAKSVTVYFWCAYALAVMVIITYVVAYFCTSPLAARRSCERRWFKEWKSELIAKNETYEIPLLAEGTAVVETLQPASIDSVRFKNVITELLNFHLFLASMLTLKSMKVALCRRPLCRYLNREDVRLALWIVAFSIIVLCVWEYALLYSGNDGEDRTIVTYLASSQFLLMNRTVNQIASCIKIFMIAVTLLIRIPGIRNRLVHYTLDVAELNLNVFIAIHLLQDESFTKWAVLLIIPYVVDSYSFQQIDETRGSLDANFCSSNGGLIVHTRREGMNFLPGDIFILNVEQVSVTSTVPAWVISSPSDRSTVKLLIHEGHWQTKVLRQLLKNMKNEIGNFKKDLPNFDADCSNASAESCPTSPSSKRRKLSKRNVLILSSDGDPAESRWPNATVIQMSSSLYARIKGPFRSVHFEEYAAYSSVMLLITPKSAGAVVAFLKQHAETRSEQKVVLFFAATEFRRVEWFIAELVKLELSVMDRHLEHGNQNRANCESCRMFFRVYLTSATSGQDARIMWVQLAMAVLAEGRSNDIEHLQKSLYPDMNVVALDKELFQDLQFMLCDAEFPYADAFSASAGNATQEIRYF